MAFALLYILNCWIETLHQSFYFAKTKQVTHFHCAGCLCCCLALATVLNVLYFLLMSWICQLNRLYMYLAIAIGVVVVVPLKRSFISLLFVCKVVYTLKVSLGFSIDFCVFLNYNRNKCKVW